VIATLFFQEREMMHSKGETFNGRHPASPLKVVASRKHKRTLASSFSS